MRSRPGPAPLLLLCLAACTSQPQLPRALVVAPGQRTRIELVDFGTKVSLVLQNGSSGSLADVYSDSRGTVSTKVIADEELQQLLDVLAAQGMFAAAGAAAAPEARAAIVVEQPDRRFVWSRPRPRPDNLDAVRAFDEGRGYVMTVYNSATAFHALDEEEMAAMRAAIQRAKAGQRGAGLPQNPPPQERGR